MAAALRPAYLSLGAAALALVALAVSFIDDSPEGQLFFSVALPAAVLQAWALSGPRSIGRRRLAAAIAVTWVGAAVWISMLLLWYQAGASRPGPLPPEATYLGLTASVYHLVALWGGAALVTAAVVLGRRPADSAGGAS